MLVSHGPAVKSDAPQGESAARRIAELDLSDIETSLQQTMSYAVQGDIEKLMGVSRCHAFMSVAGMRHATTACTMDACMHDHAGA
jgi:hypothetical protein